MTRPSASQGEWQQYLSRRSASPQAEQPGQAAAVQADLGEREAALVSAEAQQVVGAESTETNPDRLAADEAVAQGEAAAASQVQCSRARLQAFKSGKLGMQGAPAAVLGHRAT